MSVVVSWGSDGGAAAKSDEAELKYEEAEEEGVEGEEEEVGADAGRSSLSVFCPIRWLCSRARRFAPSGLPRRMSSWSSKASIC